MACTNNGKIISFFQSLPGGCTSKVQPLDVSLNKLFKSYIRYNWSDYIISESRSLAPYQKIKAPTKALAAPWMSAGICRLQEKPDMISHSFEACGITSLKATDIRPTEHLDGQGVSDSEGEHDNPFADDQSDGNNDILVD